MTFDPPAGVRASTEEIDRAAAARDLWPGGTLELWLGGEAPRPDVVTWPATEAEVLAVLERASAADVPVIPYGAGSGVCGGARGREGAVVLDLKALDHIGPLDTERWTVEAEAGVNGQHLEDWLQERGFTLGHSPSSIWCSTVGGWAAARSAGQFSSRYGVFEDMVLRMRVATPGLGMITVGEDGDAPGEWMSLLLGSEGTLGVITRVRMRVWPLPAARSLRGYRFASMAAAIRAMRTLMQEELHPAVVRLYDPVDTRIGGRTRKEARARAGGRSWMSRILRVPGVDGRALALPLALPRLVNALFDGVASGCLLIVGWEGDPQVVAALSEAGHAICSEEGEDLGEGPGERWLHARHHVSYKLMPIFEQGGFADTMEVAARWSQLLPLYEAVRRALGRTTIVMAHLSHVYPEGGSIYFSFAGRGDPAVYAATWQAALEACLAAGGTVTHHHGVGSLKAAAASAEMGPAIAGWRELKAVLDPRETLNPGRLFVDVPPRDPGPVAPLSAADGLARAPVSAELDARREVAAVCDAEPRWPWERLPGLPRWQRAPWQVGWTELDAVVDGQRCRVGRGPRSAAGPDLRDWVAARADATATFATAGPGQRFLGRGRPARPWDVALALLRSDLRPAVLTVQDGTLVVGFRGAAAAALGRIAASRVPGGLQEGAWELPAYPVAPLERCDASDPLAVWVSPSGAWRPISHRGEDR